jgi:hypothetical protein
LSDGTVRNIYDVRLRNMRMNRAISCCRSPKTPICRCLSKGNRATRVTVAPDEQALLRVYLTAPPGTQSNTAQSSPVRIWANLSGGTERVYSDTVFNGRNQ